VLTEYWTLAVIGRGFFLKQIGRGIIQSNFMGLLGLGCEQKFPGSSVDTYTQVLAKHK
jgi:hypothetical protein